MSDDVIDISSRRPVEPRPDPDPPDRFRIDLDPDSIDEALATLAKRTRKLVDRHRNSKVRLTYKGKPLLADVPIAVFLASEAASLWWLGPLRVLLVNLGARSFIEVEFVNDADDLIAEGNALYLDAEVSAAEGKYRQALERRPGDPSALYHLGVLLRVSGRKDEAIAALEQAADWGTHPDAAKAHEMLVRLGRRPLEPTSE